MDQVWRSMLQYFWANGYDLAQGAAQGWLSEATLAGHSPEWVWERLSTLPRRRGWTFQEPDGATIQQLQDIRVIPPDFSEVVQRTLQGAELGVRAALNRLGWPTRHPISHPLVAVLTSWERHLQLPDNGRVFMDAPDPLDALLRRYGPSALRYNPYAESTSIFPVAVLSGLLWPGQLQRAQSEIYRWSAFYRGGAWAAAWWIANIVVHLPWNAVMTTLEPALTSLPSASQVRALTMDAFTAYHRGDRYDQWVRRLWSQTRYYPADHVAPNSAIIVAALCWGRGNWNDIITNLCNAGFDPVYDAMVVGALAWNSRSGVKVTSEMNDLTAAQAVDYLVSNIIDKAHIQSM